MRLSQENQTTITISKGLKQRLENFKSSFGEDSPYKTWDDLLLFMVKYMEEAIPDDEEEVKEGD